MMSLKFAIFALAALATLAFAGDLENPYKAKLGIIEFHDFKTGEVAAKYQMTADDVVWAAAMIETEGGGENQEHGAALLWTIAQRVWCHKRFLPGKGHKLANYYRAFSQPINPAWTCKVKNSQCSEFCENGKPNASAYKLKSGSPCYGPALEKRAAVQSDPKAYWRQLPESARRTALLFAQGKLPNPAPGTTDWLDKCGNDRNPNSRKAWSYRDGDATGFVDWCPIKGDPVKGHSVNTFYYERCDGEKEQFSDRWTGNEVRVKGAEGNESDVLFSPDAALAMVKKANKSGDELTAVAEDALRDAKTGPNAQVQAEESKPEPTVEGKVSTSDD